MEYSNWRSLPGLWANSILKLKRAFLLFINLEIEIAVKSRRTVRKLRKWLSYKQVKKLHWSSLAISFENDCHINKLKNSIDQVLLFHSIVRYFTQIDIISLTLSFWNSGRFVLTHFWVIVHSIFNGNYCQLGNQ